MFAPSNVTRQLHFAYNMRGERDYLGTLRLDSWGGSGLTTLWQHEGPRDLYWHIALVTIPQDAEVLQFAGVAGEDYGSLDAIGVGVPELQFEDLTCNFQFDTCLWSSTGNVSWKQGSSSRYGYKGYYNRWLLAAGNESEGDFGLEFPEFNPTTAEKAVLLSFRLTGSSSSSLVSLQVEHKTEVAGWLPLFSEIGPTGPTSATWKDRGIRVPEGTVALRLLAGADAASTVEVGEIMAVDTVPNLANGTNGRACRQHPSLQRVGAHGRVHVHV